MLNASESRLHAPTFSSSSANTEWEAAKNAEPVKEPPSQAVIVEAMAAPITHAETYSQQVVSMMPVQVQETYSCGRRDPV